MKHQTRRVRHDTRRRTLQVISRQYVTPKMLRVVLGADLDADELRDFISPSPEDHIKLYVPGENGQLESRDFTPRFFDASTQQLTIDIALHPAGPAIEWAQTVEPGEHVDISGPRGSLIIPNDFDWWLLIGDETALPAIARRVESLSPGTQVTTLVTVADRAEQQVFSTQANHHAVWVHRSPGDAANPEPLMRALMDLQLPSGEGFVWIAAEARVARAARNHLLNELRHPVQWLRACGYWVKGKADTYEKLESTIEVPERAPLNRVSNEHNW